MFFFSLTWFNLDAKIQPFLIKKTFLHFFFKNFILCSQKPAGILQGYDIMKIDRLSLKESDRMAPSHPITAKIITPPFTCPAHKVSWKAEQNQDSSGGL